MFLEIVIRDKMELMFEKSLDKRQFLWYNPFNERTKVRNCADFA